MEKYILQISIIVAIYGINTHKTQVHSLALGTLVNQRWLTNFGHDLPTLANQS